MASSVNRKNTPDSRWSAKKAKLPSAKLVMERADPNEPVDIALCVEALKRLPDYGEYEVDGTFEEFAEVIVMLGSALPSTADWYGHLWTMEFHTPVTFFSLPINSDPF